MAHEQQRQNGGGFLSGLLFGGLIGAATSLLMAPRSGEETRAMLRDRGLHLRGRVGDSMMEARTRVTAAADEVRARAEELQRRSQQVVEEQKGRVRRTTRAAVEAWNEGETDVTTTP